ncbi:putative solute:sodium symporter small subunit [Salinibacterium sp. CAN_S4]|uniref:heavy metal transporter n=1 Tax=Salinibacterium sp. CAN_S4 TaxID=2787727 RepID=UPI001A279857
MTVDPPAEPSALPRRRVTAPRRASADQPVGPAVDPGIPDASAVYLGTLIRAQLRLATTLAIGFVMALAAASVAIATIPALQSESVFGVPWSWALQAYGMYPLVVVFALVYVRASRRNEQRYRSLESRR